MVSFFHNKIALCVFWPSEEWRFQYTYQPRNKWKQSYKQSDCVLLVIIPMETSGGDKRWCLCKVHSLAVYPAYNNIPRQYSMMKYFANFKYFFFYFIMKRYDILAIHSIYHWESWSKKILQYMAHLSFFKKKS